MTLLFTGLKIWRILGSVELLVGLVCVFSIMNYHAFMKQYLATNQPSLFGWNSNFRYVAQFFLQLFVFVLVSDLLPFWAKPLLTLYVMYGNIPNVLTF